MFSVMPLYTLFIFLYCRSHAAPEGRSTPKFEPTIVANEVTDEKTTLLEAEGGSLHSHPPQGEPHSLHSLPYLTSESSTGASHNCMQTSA